MSRGAERLVVRVLARLHREQPLAGDFRGDAIVARTLEASTASRPRSHRGARSSEVDEAAIRQALDDLSTAGVLSRTGRRFAIAGHRPRLDPEMQRRADELVADLLAMGTRPAPVSRVARAVGVPEAVIAFLRSSGELVEVAPGIDYPAQTLRSLEHRLRRLAEAEGSVSVGRFRDVAGTGRRHALALLEYFDARGVTLREGDLHRLPGRAGRVPEAESRVCPGPRPRSRQTRHTSCPIRGG